MKKLVVLVSLFSSLIAQACISDKGQVVDWWVTLKAPGKVSGFGYFDAAMQKVGAKTFSITKGKSFMSEGSAVHSTLKQINTMDVEKLAWNDQPPMGDASSYVAHSKAAIAFSLKSNQGFMIDHSLPRFPEFDSSRKIILQNGQNSNTYGQHLFCMSLSLEELEKVAEQVIYIAPYIYEKDISDTPEELKKCPNLMTLQNIKVTTPDKFKYANFTAGSTNVKAIFKVNRKNVSIFGDSGEGGGLIQLVNSPILVETWRGDDGSYCPRHNIDTVVDHLLLQGPTVSHDGLPSRQQFFSVEYIRKLQLGQGIAWVRTQDHSKWAVAKNNAWACFGGMNRQKSQWTRGGQFFCMLSPGLNSALKSIIVKHQPCSI